jgi:predicted NAD/FAD-binding protein
MPINLWRLLMMPALLERELLGAFGFQHNHAVLHSDASLMPKRRGAWAAWNYVSEAAAPASTWGGW